METERDTFEFAAGLDGEVSADGDGGRGSGFSIRELALEGWRGFRVLSSPSSRRRSLEEADFFDSLSIVPVLEDGPAFREADGGRGGFPGLLPLGPSNLSL
eukprot:TRINITY_DN5018_c0_g1_i1.p2 TRINITY_DN5018_c0_g1~~TRINITY_DN5018_c0_g1_i1.p2  ORF type:complete len:101 (+),score=16.09 TRINITY_DN5018_c0_g1_i1:213-515(+)